jgi:hypothetical protein
MSNASSSCNGANVGSHTSIEYCAVGQNQNNMADYLRVSAANAAFISRFVHYRKLLSDAFSIDRSSTPQCFGGGDGREIHDSPCGYRRNEHIYGL